MIFIQKGLHASAASKWSKGSHGNFQRTIRYAVYRGEESEGVLVWFGEGDRDGERKIFCRYHWSSKSLTMWDAGWVHSNLLTFYWATDVVQGTVKQSMTKIQTNEPFRRTGDYFQMSLEEYLAEQTSDVIVPIKIFFNVSIKSAVKETVIP